MSTYSTPHTNNTYIYRADIKRQTTSLEKIKHNPMNETNEFSFSSHTKPTSDSVPNNVFGFQTYAKPKNEPFGFGESNKGTSYFEPQMFTQSVSRPSNTNILSKVFSKNYTLTQSERGMLDNVKREAEYHSKQLYNLMVRTNQLKISYSCPDFDKYDSEIKKIDETQFKSITDFQNLVSLYEKKKTELAKFCDELADLLRNDYDANCYSKVVKESEENKKPVDEIQMTHPVEDNYESYEPKLFSSPEMSQPIEEPSEFVEIDSKHLRDSEEKETLYKQLIIEMEERTVIYQKEIEKRDAKIQELEAKLSTIRGLVSV